MILEPLLSSPTGFDPSWECFIDGTPITIGDALTTGPYNNQNLCGPVANLADGKHKVTMNVVSQTTQAFWFDYFQYVPSLDANLDNQVVQLMPTYSDFVYGPGWSNLKFDTSMKVASQHGTTFNFTFEGDSSNKYISIHYLNFVKAQS